MKSGFSLQFMGLALKLVGAYLTSKKQLKIGTNLGAMYRTLSFLMRQLASWDLLSFHLKVERIPGSNMQQDPLLEQLDWFFTSVNWTTTYPNRTVHLITKPVSDHIPCKIVIGTSKSTVFRFQNFYPSHPAFLETVTDSWISPRQEKSNYAATLAFKLKNLRYSLNRWSKSLSNITALIDTCNKVIFYLDSLEECRPLFLMEWNLRNTVKAKLLQLLRYKNIYWKKRHK